jgi:hypothetical protein
MTNQEPDWAGPGNPHPWSNVYSGLQTAGQGVPGSPCEKVHRLLGGCLSSHLGRAGHAGLLSTPREMEQESPGGHEKAIR